MNNSRMEVSIQNPEILNKSNLPSNTRRLSSRVSVGSKIEKPNLKYQCQSDNVSWVNIRGSNYKGGFIYNPDACPADIDLAKKHEKATSVGRPVSLENLHNFDSYCPCCGLDSSIVPLPYCIPISNLSFLGGGFPLYFKYLQFLVFTAVLSFFMLGLYLMINNLTGNYCDHTNICDSNFYRRLSAANTNYLSINIFEKILSLVL